MRFLEKEQEPIGRLAACTASSWQDCQGSENIPHSIGVGNDESGSIVCAAVAISVARIG